MAPVAFQWSGARRLPALLESPAAASAIFDAPETRVGLVSPPAGASSMDSLRIGAQSSNICGSVQLRIATHTSTPFEAVSITALADEANARVGSAQPIRGRSQP